MASQKKSFLRLLVDVHVEDEAKVTSSINDNIEDVVRLKSNEEASIDLKFQHSEQENSVGDTITKYKGTNIYQGINSFFVKCFSVTIR